MPSGPGTPGRPSRGWRTSCGRYEQLATEVTLLEQRLRSGAGDPRQVATSAERLKGGLPTAAAVGDLEALGRRVDGLLEKTAVAVEEHKAARAVAKEESVLVLTALAEEAEKLAVTSSWKDAGERLRTIGQDWKRITGVDKKTADALWERVAASRARFAERRTAHFGALEQQRSGVPGAQGEAGQGGRGAGRLDRLEVHSRPLQAADDRLEDRRPCPREVEDTLWNAFKGAQDVFFQARSAAFAEKDEEFRGNQKVKEEILAEAEALQVPGGKARLRQLQEKWEAAGKVPRDVMKSLEDRFAKVEEKFRATADTSHVKTTESPFVVRLKEKVADLEGKLAKARAEGRSDR